MIMYLSEDDALRPGVGLGHVQCSHVRESVPGCRDQSQDAARAAWIDLLQSLGSCGSESVLDTLDNWS